MGSNTKIQWTDNTFNPWWGCTRVSKGCAHCYAEKFANRFDVKWGQGAPRRLSSEKVWAQPLIWNKSAEKKGVRAKVFCASMADWADNEAPDGARDRLWDLIRKTEWLDWQLLTKRPENVEALLPKDWKGGYLNVWLGFTAEDQESLEKRLKIFRKIPAHIKFISAEPLLGPLDLSGPLKVHQHKPSGLWVNSGLWPDINWVIAGGESGPGARVPNPSWFKSIRDQCAAAAVPFFFKQWGAWGPEQIDPIVSMSQVAVFNQNDTGENPVYVKDLEPSLRGAWSAVHPGDAHMYLVGKEASGRLLDGQEWSQFPV